MLVDVPSLWFSFSLAVTVRLPKLMAWLLLLLLLLFVLILFAFVDVVFISLKILLMDDPSAVLVVMISVLPAFVLSSALPDCVELETLTLAACCCCRNAVANCWLCGWLDDTTTRWMVLFMSPWTVPLPPLFLLWMGTIFTTFGLIWAKNWVLPRLFFRFVYKMRVRSICGAICLWKTHQDREWVW